MPQHVKLSKIYGHKLIACMTALQPCAFSDSARIKWELIKRPRWILRMRKAYKKTFKQAWKTAVSFWLMRLTASQTADDMSNMNVNCECH